MKNLINKLLGLTSILGGCIGSISKNRTLKVIGYGSAAISAGVLIKRMYDEEKKKVETQIEETERAINDSGLNAESLAEVINNTKEHEEEDVFLPKQLLRYIYQNSVYSDDVLGYDGSGEEYYHTLHILPTEKGRIKVSIPLRRKQKYGLNPQDMRNHFYKVYSEFVEDHKIDMKVYMNQVGYHVGYEIDDDNEVVTWFNEIEREPEEIFRDYLDRITEIIELWDSGDKGFRKENEMKYGMKTFRFEQHLELEFPVFPQRSNKKGLDLITGMELINTLMDQFEIKTQNGKDVNFQFRHIIFHPTDEFSEIYLLDKKGNIIEYHF